jgi:hypothetical protein
MGNLSLGILAPDGKGARVTLPKDHSMNSITAPIRLAAMRRNAHALDHHDTGSFHAEDSPYEIISSLSFLATIDLQILEFHQASRS